MIGPNILSTIKPSSTLTNALRNVQVAAPKPMASVSPNLLHALSSVLLPVK
jgi:hypothetical protein